MLALQGYAWPNRSVAQSLSRQGLAIKLIEKHGLDQITNPLFDGREITLTQQSVTTLSELDIWARIDKQAVSQLKFAKILNGSTPNGMLISHDLTQSDQLGWLVANQLIRRAAFAALQQNMNEFRNIELVLQQSIRSVKILKHSLQIYLSNGEKISTKLLIAADSRYSSTRRLMGIATDLHDFGRTMLVCYMTHATPHLHTALEWFNYAFTLALLPMNPDPLTGMHRSSVVITAPHAEIDALLNTSEDLFSATVTKQFDHRLGPMHLVSTRHVYPLVSTYPQTFVANRFALLGDAAVGMHPITAHGFNFGLLGVTALSQAIVKAHNAGNDIGNPYLLSRYNQQHRYQTRPLYVLTQLLAKMYAMDSVPAKGLRKALLYIGEQLTPIKRHIAVSLTGTR